MWRRTGPSTFWYIHSSNNLGLESNLNCWQVFGEALLNDGVTFVLYEGVKELAFVEDDNIGDISVPVYIYLCLNPNILKLINSQQLYLALGRLLYLCHPLLLHRPTGRVPGRLPDGSDGRPGDQVHQREGRVPQAHPQPPLCLPRLHDHSPLRILKHPRRHCLRHCTDPIRSGQHEVSSLLVFSSSFFLFSFCPVQRQTA